ASAAGTGGYQGSNANGSQVNAGFNAVLPMPRDSVQEFRVTVGGGGPSEGRSSGGQVALVTKSGTNQLHGSAYEYNRNTATAANTWFNNKAGVPVQPLIRNQFGASAGGKIVHDRIFYFLNYEQRIDASGVSQARVIPSDSLRQGVLKFQLDDGSIQTLTPAEVKRVDPLNAGVNSNMMAVLNRYPVGNDPAYGQDGGLNFSGFRFNAQSHTNDRALVGKLDFHLDSAGKHNLRIRCSIHGNSQAESRERVQPGLHAFFTRNLWRRRACVVYESARFAGEFHRTRIQPASADMESRRRSDMDEGQTLDHHRLQLPPD